MIVDNYRELAADAEEMLYAMNVWTAADYGDVEVVEGESGVVWRVVGTVRFYPDSNGWLDRRPRRGITIRERNLLRAAAVELFMELPTLNPDWIEVVPARGVSYWEIEVWAEDHGLG